MCFRRVYFGYKDILYLLILSFLYYNIIYRETCLGNIHIIRTLSYKQIHLSYQKITQLDFDVKPKCELKNVRFF